MRVCRVWVMHVRVHYLAPIEIEIDACFLNWIFQSLVLKHFRGQYLVLCNEPLLPLYRLTLDAFVSLCLSMYRLNVFSSSLDTMSTISPTDFDSLEIQQQYNDINNRWDLAAETDWDNENSSARLFERSRIKALAGMLHFRPYQCANMVSTCTYCMLLKGCKMMIDKYLFLFETLLFYHSLAL